MSCLLHSPLHISCIYTAALPQRYQICTVFPGRGREGQSEGRR